MVDVMYREMREAMVAVKVSTEVLRMRDQLIAERCCLACKEKIPADKPVKKGQCTRCYQLTRSRLRDKKVTERQLRREGLWCDGKPGRPATSTYAQRLSE